MLRCPEHAAKSRWKSGICLADFGNAPRPRTHSFALLWQGCFESGRKSKSAWQSLVAPSALGQACFVCSLRTASSAISSCSSMLRLGDDAVTPCFGKLHALGTLVPCLCIRNASDVYQALGEHQSASVLSRHISGHMPAQPYIQKTALDQSLLKQSGLGPAPRKC